MKNNYESPFSSRYGSEEMRQLFSQEMKFTTWRNLWIILAKAEKELGLPITDEQIAELEDKMYDINYEVAEKIEKETHHDVMAHIHAYGIQCPNAAGIIHLGATSSYITDNTDVVTMRSALDIIEDKMLVLIAKLNDLASRYKDTPTLAYTHYQPAQPTTIGKRFCMWAQDFDMDQSDIRHIIYTMKTLGCKGATGTQASFLKLFDGDYEKVKQLDEYVCNAIGIEGYDITGQTYPRKLDKRVYDVLSSIAVSASKMANDIRLLQHDGELREPFCKNQVGSSAMAYKRNPLNCEKIVGLARRVITDSLNPALTASVQWLERTLDDSSNRRLVISEGFLAVDEILNTCIKVIDGLVVDLPTINKHLSKEIPHIIMEDIIMDLVKRGYSRQDVHETMRQISMSRCDIISEIAYRFNIPIKEVKMICSANRHIGCAEKQVKEYLYED